MRSHEKECGDGAGLSPYNQRFKSQMQSDFGRSSFGRAVWVSKDSGHSIPEMLPSQIRSLPEPSASGAAEQHINLYCAKLCKVYLQRNAKVLQMKSESIEYKK